MPSTVLIVGAGLLQIPAIEIAQRLGYRVTVTDRDPNAAGFALADDHVLLDTKDVDGHVALARELAACGDLAAVFTEGADVEVTVAEAARAAGLPGVDPQAARVVNDKAAFRRCCAAAGLPGPRFREVDAVKDARAAVRDIGLPVIIKALDNSGSRGATKVVEPGAVDAAFEEAMRWTGSSTVLVEECLSGPEQSVETIVADGVHHRCNIVDRPFAFDPYPIEIGHDNPTVLDAGRREEIYALVEASARAAGIDLGAAKADTMWTARGPVVLEMTARLSGGFHCQIHLAAGVRDERHRGGTRPRARQAARSRRRDAALGAHLDLPLAVSAAGSDCRRRRRAARARDSRRRARLVSNGDRRRDPRVPHLRGPPRLCHHVRRYPRRGDRRDGCRGRHDRDPDRAPRRDRDRVSLASQHRMPAGPGLHAVADEAMQQLEFVLARVAAGEVRELVLGDREAVIVKLEGGAGVIEVDDDAFELPARVSVFLDGPSAVYAPPGTTARLHGPLLAGL